jgi:hypothetical protein
MLFHLFDITVSVYAWSAVHRGFEAPSGQTKDD